MKLLIRLLKKYEGKTIFIPYYFDGKNVSFLEVKVKELKNDWLQMIFKNDEKNHNFDQINKITSGKNIHFISVKN